MLQTSSSSSSTATSFKLSAYQFASGMDKTNASHHAMQGFSYYQVPIDKEPDLAHLIVKAWCQCKPLTLCEHIPAGQRFRFYIDFDFEESAALTDLIEASMYTMVKSISEGDLERFRHLVNMDILKEWHVMLKEIDPFLCVVLRAANSAKTAYHIVWPFILVGPKRAGTMLADIQKNLAETKHGFPTHKIEQPKTLRAPFCDKAGKEPPFALEGRPYVYSGCYSRKGKMRPYRDQSPCYPFPDENDTVSQQEFGLAVWAMTSLRFTHYCSELRKSAASVDDSAFVPREEYLAKQKEKEKEVAAVDADAAQRERPGVESATSWYRSGTKYASKHMQELLDLLPDEASNEVITKCVVDYINECCGVCMFGDACVAFKQNAEDDQTEIGLLARAQARTMMCAPSVKLTVDAGKGKKRTITKAPFDIWIDSPNRREFEKIVFDASGAEIPLNHINTWVGFRYTDAEVEKIGVTFDTGNFGVQRFLAHIFNVLCNKNVEVWLWLLKWIAFQFQNPGVSCCSAVLCAGNEGCGKSIVFNNIGYLFGRHYLCTSSIEDLCGRFNARILGKVFVLINELDLVEKATNSQLKALITDDIKRTENKFHMPLFVNQGINLCATTNRPHDDIVHVGAQARRYLMLHCKTMPQCDRAYFNAMSEFFVAQNHSGHKSLYFLFRNLDLSNFDPRTVPVTTMLLQHKMANMPYVHQFWWECLCRGEIANKVVGPVTGNPSHSYEHIVQRKWEEGEGVTIDEFDLHYVYTCWCNQSRTRSVGAYKFLMLISQAVRFTRKRLQSVDFVDFHGGAERVAESQRQILSFPPLKECVAAFSKLYTHMERHFISENEENNVVEDDDMFEDPPFDLLKMKAGFAAPIDKD
jgi:hypothetical protein